MSNEAARAARNEALRRHRREVGLWKSLLFPVAGISLAIGVVLGMLIKEATKEPPKVWRTDKAPVGEPYWVVTQAYVRKHDKQWCNVTNGEPIEVSHWTTAQP